MYRQERSTSSGPAGHPACVAGRSDDDFKDAEARLGVSLPAWLREVYRAGDGRYRSDGEWWIVWPLERLVEENVRLWDIGTLDDSLVAFGDDGTGSPFCMSLNGASSAIARWSFIDGAVEEQISQDRFRTEWLGD